MPFRNYDGFNTETLRIMTVAYDAAIARLSIKSDNPLTSELAAKIVALVANGERDPDKLCERAMAELQVVR